MAFSLAGFLKNDDSVPVNGPSWLHFSYLSYSFGAIVQFHPKKLITFIMFVVNLQNSVSKIDISCNWVLVEKFAPDCYNWEVRTNGRKPGGSLSTRMTSTTENRLSSSYIVFLPSLNRIAPLGYVIDRRCPGVLWIRESYAFCQRGNKDSLI